MWRTNVFYVGHHFREKKGKFLFMSQCDRPQYQISYKSAVYVVSEITYADIQAGKHISRRCRFINLAFIAF
jgi:hypothetical protein